MTRLSDATLHRLPPTVERPRYDRRAVRAGVVHLGVGAFHRAHQAIYFEDALNRGDMRWGITGASLRSAAVRDRLRPQDGLYSVTLRDAQCEHVQVVGALQRVLVEAESPDALVAALADPAVHLVTLTITEKGYAGAGAGAGAGTGAVGVLKNGLAMRRARGLSGLTAISCDNLASNGERLRDAVLGAASDDEALADWIVRHATFPSTMVDRMVPAATGADGADAATRLGLEDHAAIVTEPFRQWVIEDRFAGEHPDWDLLGVQSTRDIARWEEAKLRLLNGAHSAMAYLGQLAGIEHVHEFLALPESKPFVDALMIEARATLMPPPGLDLDAYRVTLMRRFANPALKHQTRQIATDGSQKLPQRLLAPLTARLDRGWTSPALTLAVAGWIDWVGRRTAEGAFTVADDPLAPEIHRALRGTIDPEEQVASLLSIAAIFPRRLAADERLCLPLRDAVATLRTGDVAGAMGQAASSPSTPRG